MNRIGSAAMALCMLLSGCAGLAPAPRTPIVPPHPTAAVAPAVPPTKAPAAARPAATLPVIRIPAAAQPGSATPTPLATSDRIVLAEGLPGPDDIALGPGGSLYISDVADGTIKQLASGGELRSIASGLSVPEGIVVLPDGQLIVAEQGKNRLLRLDPATGQHTLFLQLTNRTGQTGVDGIALDVRQAGDPTVIVPDSANGTVLRASLDGKQVHEIGRGFVRPVAAWAEPGGAILVADEFGNALVRLHPDGRRETIARLGQPDDVVGDDQGHVYTNTLVDGAVHAISLADGSDTVVVDGLAMPQGIVLDGQGNLIVVDSGHGRILKVGLRP